MTTGQLLFYVGAALLAATVLLAVIFAMKQPVYHPENAVYAAGDDRTQKLRNGYPTDRLTIRRESGMTAPPNTAALKNETERLTELQAEPLPETDAPRGTVLLTEQETAKLDDGTIPLSAEETAPLRTAEETELLL